MGSTDQLETQRSYTNLSQCWLEGKAGSVLTDKRIGKDILSGIVWKLDILEREYLLPEN